MKKILTLIIKFLLLPITILILLAGSCVPKAKIVTISEGGTGTFEYALTNAKMESLSITTDADGVAKASPTIEVKSSDDDVTINQSSMPSGWNLDTVECKNKDDDNVGNLNGTTYTIPKELLSDEEIYTCTFTNVKDECPEYDLSFANVHVNQSIQKSDPSSRIPLVENRSAVLRAFVVANCEKSLANTPLIKALITLPNGSSFTRNLEGEFNPVPTTFDESHSYHLNLLSDWMINGTTIELEIDPESAIEGEVAGNNIEELTVETQELDPLLITLVPIIYDNVSNTDPNTNFTIPNLPLNGDSFLRQAENMLPLPTGTIKTVRSPFGFRGNLSTVSGWIDLLNKMAQLRLNENATGNQYYYAIVNPQYEGGFISGIALLNPNFDPNNKVGVIWHRVGSTFAHELGHNWNRNHVSGCGNPASPDSNFPHSGGKIGFWGIDPTASVLSLKNPAEFSDVMTYCSERWISDYTYQAMFDYRLTERTINNESPPLPEIIGNEIASFLVSGQITFEGDQILSGKLEEIVKLEGVPVNNFPLEGVEKPYTLKAFGENDNGEEIVLFEHQFAATEIADPQPSEPEALGLNESEISGKMEQFTFNITVESNIIEQVKSYGFFSNATSAFAEVSEEVAAEFDVAGEIELDRVQSSLPDDVAFDVESGAFVNPLNNGLIKFTWNSEIYPKIIIRDGPEGEVLSITTVEEGEETGEIVIMPTADTLEVTYSDGINSHTENIEVSPQ